MIKKSHVPAKKSPAVAKPDGKKLADNGGTKRTGGLVDDELLATSGTKGGLVDGELLAKGGTRGGLAGDDAELG
ncbi:hypothetical protein [Duganella violaceipulchra]|uniref:Uncharacterized protein n=1 Tax=Duganella violaceipulchra TaxID=2849652 RepID=A0AA41H5F3_9BURK|nr:hypothetical protein [Duganella violaceicalia]MBV6321952.1 hypothetical protein [Duganella violaceicalia]MCP2007053.1 hypothetical protein [Duganella violaceicalia]